jgi:drug/metabolite transporter (DMT)-like permease
LTAQAQRGGPIAARYALLLAGVTGLSWAGIFYSLSAAPPIAMVAYRSLFAAVLILPLVFIGRWSGSRDTTARFGRRDIALSTIAGALFAADLTLWAVGIRFTTVSSAMLMVSTDPIWIALFSALFFAERPRPLAIVGIGVAVCGTAIVAGMDLRVSGTALLGDGLALAAALVETWYLLLGRRVRLRVDAPRYATIVYAACAACMWIAMFASGTSPAVSMHDLGFALLLALVVTVGGHTLISHSLGLMPATVVGVAILAQPPIAALLAYLFLHQTIPLTTAVGGLVALTGLGIVAYANELKNPGIEAGAI